MEKNNHQPPKTPKKPHNPQAGSEIRPYKELNHKIEKIYVEFRGHRFATNFVFLPQFETGELQENQIVGYLPDCVTDQPNGRIAIWTLQDGGYVQSIHYSRHPDQQSVASFYELLKASVR